MALRVILRFSRRAASNPSEIRAYTIETHGHAQAAVYRAKLKEGLNSLQHFPDIGLTSPHLPRGHRAFRIAHHWICYQVTGEIIAVKAIIRRLDEF